MNHPAPVATADAISREEELDQPLTYGVEAFLSRDYAEREKTHLWPFVWQQAGRVEDIPHIGDFITHDVGDDSIIIVRTASDELKAYHNVCPHRGRRLIDVPPRAHHARGHRRAITCGFHGWTFGLDGEARHILDKQDWKGCLDDPARTRLSDVRVDSWGGWIFINMDADCAPLRDFLEPAAGILDPFELEKMRYKWRQWVVFDCNWKTALEAFMEAYHVTGTHTQMLRNGDYYSYSAAYGLHGVSGFDQRDATVRTKEGSSVTRTGKSGVDPRLSTYDLQNEIYTTVNNAGTTETLVNAARRLVDELPEGTAPEDVIAHWLASAKADDAARGILWPGITPEQTGKAGLAWHVFPNVAVLQGVTFALCYRTRPHGDDPNRCIFEAYAIERFPDGEEPKPDWVYAEPTEEHWGLVLAQDFSNMAAVQKGMKSRGFRGTLPNPHQEQKVTNFHRNLAQYIGMGGPRPI
ncbi:aromatic ring-hydroxylating dioxygenase subunit alpha [Sphingobium sufflavum]|uniref:aromatic ring-hydroxylating oxygenase subunit alpha n=1 Tax=Sphingobium sufflavum TaxID=1129547 RepID=UPI001F39F021|nr:aromatic ring-hydroxylating dioxygenase subunit alpha [Sphingobium sufflavum]MCE7796408.1 aromatic ring-hydroxylating dioxygenase subunit alpha [Sphingobium sufflavum]